MKWICCQIGAREHYATPRALHRQQLLEHLYTDIWAPPGWLGRRLSRDLAGRFHEGLASAAVSSFNAGAYKFEVLSRIHGLSGWKLFLKRNDWFQQRIAHELAGKNGTSRPAERTVFAYSYAARRILEFAHEQGWRTVLGQIDPGPVEERIVARLYRDNPEFHAHWQPAPEEYWGQWRRECGIADCIAVNSPWSLDALVQSGIPEEKIRVVPLAFEVSREAAAFERSYPVSFTRTRPLRALFLGQIDLRKGVLPILEAARMLRNEPVEFRFVGPVQISIPAGYRQDSNVQWMGLVARSETPEYYRDADVFLFPTYSDGFGLTQLEAQSWKLPVIASRYCGEVVRDGVNGVILDQVSAEEIAHTLRRFLGRPAAIREMSAHSSIDKRFNLDSLGATLVRQ